MTFRYLDPRVLRAQHKPALAQEHSEPSREAAAKIEPSRNRLQLVVYHAINSSEHGLTDEEGIEATGIAASTYRPRRIELVEHGRVMDSGRTRPTKSGRKATVWIAC